MKNPVAFTETWKIEGGNLGEPENTLVKSKKKYHSINDKEYKFMNYEAMIAEPLKVKNYNSDRKCIAFDLDEYNKQ